MLGVFKLLEIVHKTKYLMDILVEGKDNKYVYIKNMFTYSYQVVI